VLTCWQFVVNLPKWHVPGVSSLFLPLLPSSGDFPTVPPTRVGLRPGSGIPTLADRTPSEVRLRVGEFQAMPPSTLDGWISTVAGRLNSVGWLCGRHSSRLRPIRETPCATLPPCLLCGLPGCNGRPANSLLDVLRDVPGVCCSGDALWDPTVRSQWLWHW